MPNGTLFAIKCRRSTWKKLCRRPFRLHQIIVYILCFFPVRSLVQPEIHTFCYAKDHLDSEFSRNRKKKHSAKSQQAEKQKKNETKAETVTLGDSVHLCHAIGNNFHGIIAAERQTMRVNSQPASIVTKKSRRKNFEFVNMMISLFFFALLCFANSIVYLDTIHLALLCLRTSLKTERI